VERGAILGDALRCATYNNHENTARYLVTIGADPNAPDEIGCSSTWWAVGRGFYELLKLLVLAGGDIHLKNTQGVSPLDEAQNLPKQEVRDQILKFLTVDAPALTQRGGGTEQKDAEKHVMMSYNWENQALIMRIKKALQEQGIKVWMDVDDLKGSTLQAMADAVEKSVCVIMAMSEKYQESPNCRLEGEYALQQHKTILPLLVHHDFKPTGWLGMILGAKLYYDFSQSDFDAKMTQLIAAVNQVLSVHNSTVSSPKNAKSVKGGNNSGGSGVTAVRAWNSTAVESWLQSAQLSELIPTFKKLQIDSGECMGIVVLSQRLSRQLSG